MRSTFVTEAKNQGRQSDFEQVTLPRLDAAHDLARWPGRHPSTAEDVAQHVSGLASKSVAASRDGSDGSWLLHVVRNAGSSTLGEGREEVGEGEPLGLGVHAQGRMPA
jgi:DNA-directed RNA polymerase specialized sigma24 family protein